MIFVKEVRHMGGKKEEEVGGAGEEEEKVGVGRDNRKEGMASMLGGAGATAKLIAVILLIFTPTADCSTTIPTNDPRVDALSSVLREITGQLERINDVYINKLERELSANAAKMASLEAMVRGIADRAATWDNIQNHMAVWTDQSRTMERKMDILNRCHEKQETWESRLTAVDALNHKLTALDKKINAMTRLEFKVEQVSERVEEVDSKISWVKKQMANPETPIINEFAGRGLLSSLLNLENKLDNLTTKITEGDGFSSQPAYSSVPTYVSSSSTFKRPRQVNGSRYREQRPTVEPEPGIAFTYGGDGTCRLNPQDSRRLQDVSAKVDLVFDRVTDPDYEYDLLAGNLPKASPLAQSFQNGPGKGEGFESGSPEQHFARFWKSLFSPFKKINRRFRGFETQLTSIHRACNESSEKEGSSNGIGGIIQQKLVPLQDALREEMEETRMAVNDQASNIQTVSQAVTNTAYLSEQLLAEIKNQFQAQRIIFQEKHDESKNLFLQYCVNGNHGRSFPQTPVHAPSNTPVETPQIPNEPQKPRVTTTTPTPKKAPYYDASVTSGTTSSEIRDCSDLLKERITMRTLYNFTPDNQASQSTGEGHDYFTRYCDMETDGGGWTVIQRRGMFGPPFENFTMSWNDYKVGFGNLNREFWWGNDNIYRMVRDQELTIRFDLWDFEGNYAYAEYLNFRIANEKNKYKLNVFGYQGNASDSFSAHNGYLFSTYDRDHDEAPDCCPCAPAYGGGWWFYSCFESNLNGEYHADPHDNDYYKGIIWELWLGDYSLKATEIKIRPTNFVPIPTAPSNGGQENLPKPPPTYPDLYPTGTLAPELPLIQL